MKIYKFYDTDIDGIEEYDIIGNNYLSLLDCCIKHSSTFSFYYNDNVNIPDWLEKYRIDINDIILSLYYYHYGNDIVKATKEIFHLRLDTDVINWIYSVTDSIFKWYSCNEFVNPEDPAFYRSDGSIFFSSIIHDGQCTLNILDSENVDEVIRASAWISSNRKISHP